MPVLCAAAHGTTMRTICVVPPATTTIPTIATTTSGFELFVPNHAPDECLILIPAVLRNTGLVFGHDMELFFLGDAQYQ